MSERTLATLREVRRGLEDVQRIVSTGGKPLVEKGGWFHSPKEENSRYHLVNHGLKCLCEGIDHKIIHLLSTGSAPKASFAIGQVVQLKSGGPAMTICEVGQYALPAYYGVQWFLSDGTVKYDSFHADALKAVTDKEQATT